MVVVVVCVYMHGCVVGGVGVGGGCKPPASRSIIPWTASCAVFRPKCGGCRIPGLACICLRLLTVHTHAHTHTHNLTHRTCLAAGLGACAGALMYEVGRPRRFSVEEAQAQEKVWQDFGELGAAMCCACCGLVACPEGHSRPSSLPPHNACPPPPPPPPSSHHSQVCGRSAAAQRAVPRIRHSEGTREGAASLPQHRRPRQRNRQEGVRTCGMADHRLAALPACLPLPAALKGLLPRSCLPLLAWMRPAFALLPGLPTRCCCHCLIWPGLAVLCPAAQLVLNWAPDAERSANGFFKGVSLQTEGGQSQQRSAAASIDSSTDAY